MKKGMVGAVVRGQFVEQATVLEAMVELAAVEEVALPAACQPP
ncbi:hypothetical protein ABT093_16280 [Kitasatospora sp. NPDC002551]